MGADFARIVTQSASSRMEKNRSLLDDVMVNQESDKPPLG